MGLFVTIGSLFVLPWLEPGNAEYYVAWLSLGIGIVTTGVVIYAIKKLSR